MDPFNDVWPGFGRTDCQRFEGDSISHNLTWSGGAPGDLKGGIKLRFHLRARRAVQLRLWRRIGPPATLKSRHPARSVR